MRTPEDNSGSIVVRAHAKINLFLEVLGKRPDGYHNIVTSMQAVSLSDRLTFTFLPTTHLALDVVPGNPQLEGADNLAFKAARALRAYTRVSNGAVITLEKHIPTAAGLGGGSADAAATLVGLNLLWKLRLRRPELLSLASTLGSDVPYFVRGYGTALCEGRGELVTELPASDAHNIILITLPIQVSTATVFNALKLAEMHIQRPGNALQAPAERLFPEIGNARHHLEQLTGLKVYMSGSGPTLYCLASAIADADAAIAVISGAGYRAWNLKTVAHPIVLEHRSKPARVH